MSDHVYKKIELVGSSNKVWRMPFRMQSPPHQSRWSIWTGSRCRKYAVI